MKLRKRREPTEKRFRRMKKRYTEKPAQSIRLAVVDCFFWNGLTDAQTAEILGTSNGCNSRRSGSFDTNPTGASFTQPVNTRKD